VAPNVEKTYSWAVYRDELERQSAALVRRLPAIAAQARQVAEGIAARSPSLLYLVGSGDSYIAAHSCQFAYRSLSRIASFVVEAFDVAGYHAPLFDATTLVVSTSISGRTLSATASLSAARAAGAPTLLITNTPGSSACAYGDWIIELDVPSIDTSGYIPSTMSYLAGMVAQHAVAAWLGVARGVHTAQDAEAYLAELGTALAAIDPLLAAHDAPVRALVQRLNGRTPFLIGGGPCYGSALFGEAKVVESAMLPIAVQHVEEWAHIRRFLTHGQVVTIGMAVPGPSYQRMLQILRDARARGSEVIAIAAADDAAAAAIAHEVWAVPALQHEVLQPFTCGVPLELLAYWMMIEADVRPFHADLQPIQTGLTLPVTTGGPQ
jgi:glucosamine--fructose-6-phosphate aminotransferase (isomerizing)